MDKGKEQSKWGWLPVAMPGVAKLINEDRAKLGRAHVDLCWKRGVVEMQPGWFFAREGALAVGMPWEAPELANFGALQVTPGQALLMLRTPEQEGGT